MSKLADILFVSVEPNFDSSSVGVDLAAIIVRAGLAATKSEARRHIEAGAIRLNDVVVEDKFARIAKSDDSPWILVQKRG